MSKEKLLSILQLPRCLALQGLTAGDLPGKKVITGNKERSKDTKNNKYII